MTISETKVCTVCKRALPRSAFSKQTRYKDGLRYDCKDCSSATTKRWRDKHGKRYRLELKKEVFLAYGNKCACCGEAEFAFLAIDHVNNDGAAHRRKHKINTGKDTYLWLRRNNFPEGFQVLCANCNTGKLMNKGICPHKEQ